MKVTKAELMKVVRAAIDESLAGDNKEVRVQHPLFEGYVLRASRARQWRVQRFPSTVITLDQVADLQPRRNVWNTTIGYLNAILSTVVREGSVESSTKL